MCGCRLDNDNDNDNDDDTDGNPVCYFIVWRLLVRYSAVPGIAAERKGLARPDYDDDDDDGVGNAPFAIPISRGNLWQVSLALCTTGQALTFWVSDSG